MRLAPRGLVPASSRGSPGQLPPNKNPRTTRGPPPAPPRGPPTPARQAPPPEEPVSVDYRKPAVLEGDKEVRDRLLHGQVGVDRVQVAGHDISHPHPAKG